MKPWSRCSEHMMCSCFLFKDWDLYISRANETKVRKLGDTRVNVNRIQLQWKVQSGLIKSLSMWIQFPQASWHPVSDKAASLCLPLSKFQLDSGCMLVCQSMTIKACVLKMMTVAIYWLQPFSAPLIWNSRQLTEILISVYMLIE